MVMQVGGFVRFLEPNNYGLTQGTVYEITEVSESGTYIRVEGQTARTKLNVRYFEEAEEELSDMDKGDYIDEHDWYEEEFAGCCGARTLYFGSCTVIGPYLKYFLDDRCEGGTRIKFAILNGNQHTKENIKAFTEAGFRKLCESRSNHGGTLHTYALNTTDQQQVVEGERRF